MKGNISSKLRPQVLDRYTRGMIGADIAKELECSPTAVYQYIAEFKEKVKSVESKRVICKERQNSYNADIRLLCLRHASCKTCDVGRTMPKPEWREHKWTKKISQTRPK